MLKIFLILLINLSCAWALSPGQALDSATLVKIDQYRALDQHISFDLRISSFKSEKKIDEYTLKGFAGMQSNGKAASLLYFSDPQAVRGRKMLMDDLGIWVLFPRTRNVIRLSAMQVLLGEVSNGDVARLTFSTHYDAKVVKCEEDGLCELLLQVKKNQEGSTYSQIKLWVNKKTLLPVKAEFYSTVGGEKLLKTANYSQLKKISGKDILTVIDMIDGIDPQKRSRMEYLQMKKHKLPPASFNKDYLNVWLPPR
ncbi:MAG: outer membrane lipoprotein-sorting protein [Fibrobacter sp.]|nr:outer membrane lipoprotein-sorting protein [Fibrobacter sp.]